MMQPFSFCSLNDPARKHRRGIRNLKVGFSERRDKRNIQRIILNKLQDVQLFRFKNIQMSIKKMRVCPM
ncbi:hypothetical protein MA16_Dca026488 [Dendrobium catenatum]|uniref:Uncharacterized protein n=1 Tax=Dendrobium catenatum TaxID=906689 RepID=A0A2I0WJF5_9ASPA|nr:hypothetical protein MA16_Dca026488 [Dendrobium catenatum]